MRIFPLLDNGCVDCESQTITPDAVNYIFLIYSFAVRVLNIQDCRKLSSSISSLNNVKLFGERDLNNSGTFHLYDLLCGGCGVINCAWVQSYVAQRRPLKVLFKQADLAFRRKKFNEKKNRPDHRLNGISAALKELCNFHNKNSVQLREIWLANLNIKRINRVRRVLLAQILLSLSLCPAIPMIIFSLMLKSNGLRGAERKLFHTRFILI